MKLRNTLVLLFCLVMLEASSAIILAQNTMPGFGLKENELKQRLPGSLVNGYIPAYPDKKAFKAASPSVQAAFVKDTLGWVKAYTETAAFKAGYAKQREAAKPEAPKSKGSVDAQYAKYLAEQRQGIEAMKKSVAQMPPDMQKQMQATIKEMEANVERSAKDQQMAAMMKQGIQQNTLSDQKDYQDRLAAWEKKCPADPNVLIASRLHQFLDVSQSVDFNAKLVSKDGKMKFADPQYEAKPSEWKLCYRIGLEPVQAARAFAQEWLKQIEKK